jgi:hypothetical protein
MFQLVLYIEFYNKYPRGCDEPKSYRTINSAIANVPISWGTLTQRGNH